MTSLLAQISLIPTAVWVAFVASTVIPFLSALATKAPSFLTGALTLALSALDGFLAVWAKAGEGFDWRAALGATLGAWAIAALTHSKVLKGTAIEAQLHAVGTTTHHPRG